MSERVRVTVIPDPRGSWLKASCYVCCVSKASLCHPGDVDAALEVLRTLVREGGCDHIFAAPVEKVPA